MMDFVKNEFIDPFLFIDYSGTYYTFKCKIEKKEIELSAEQMCSLQFVSLEFARGIRIHELLLLKLLSEKSSVSLDDFSSELLKFGVKLTKQDLFGACNTLSPDFYTQNDKKKYGGIKYVELDENKNQLLRTTEYENLLKSSIYKAELLDCLSYGIKRVSLNPDEVLEDDNLILYRKYTRKDVCKLLNWKSDCSSTIYGYKVETSYPEYSCPIFVTYKKSDEISDTTKYDDVFIDNSRFSWMSRSRRTSASDEVGFSGFRCYYYIIFSSVSSTSYTS